MLVFFTSDTPTREQRVVVTTGTAAQLYTQLPELWGI